MVFYGTFVGPAARIFGWFFDEMALLGTCGVPVRYEFVLNLEMIVIDLDQGSVN